MAPAPARIAVSGPVLTKSGNGAKQHIELTVRGRHLAIDIDDSGASVGGVRFAFTSQKRKDAFLTGIAVFTASSRATHNSIEAPSQSRGLTGVLSPETAADSVLDCTGYAYDMLFDMEAIAVIGQEAAAYMGLPDTGVSQTDLATALDQYSGDAYIMALEQEAANYLSDMVEAYLNLRQCLAAGGVMSRLP